LSLAKQLVRRHGDIVINCLKTELFKMVDFLLLLVKASQT